jgi:hypothetical protein
MTCPKCRGPLLSCKCPDVVEQIEAFLRSEAGQSTPPPAANKLVRRACAILEQRIQSGRPDWLPPWL